jgi:hypothetical protein
VKQIKINIDKLSFNTYEAQVLVMGVLKVYTYLYDEQKNIQIRSCLCWYHSFPHANQAETDACWYYGKDWIIEELNRRTTEAEAKSLIS